MELKLLEIRDRATFIPVMAMKMISDKPEESYLLGRAGFRLSNPNIILGTIDGGSGQFECDPYDWRDTRTLRHAHKYIAENWDDIVSGDVIDVEFILGETTFKKDSERLVSG